MKSNDNFVIIFFIDCSTSWNLLEIDNTKSFFYRIDK